MRALTANTPKLYVAEASLSEGAGKVDTGRVTSFFRMALQTLLLVGLGSARFAVAQDQDANALRAVTHDLCSKSVAMLGESATHGDGHTEAFKVALVERLVNECGFDSVVFEASHYEFLHIARLLRTGQAVSANQVASAVGGLWKFDAEFQPLLPFLLEKAQAGTIALGGMDDQLAGAGQEYANVTMVAELTGLLPEPQRLSCSAALHRRIFSDYTEAAPYSAANRSEIEACLADIEVAAQSGANAESSWTSERLEMIAAARSWVARDAIPLRDTRFVADRDRSMFENFEWLRSQQPHRHKIIVWAATVHISKQAEPGSFPYRNFGSFLHEAYGSRAFSLGFSACAGSYRQGRKDALAVSPPPAGSVEAMASGAQNFDTVYLGPRQLAAVGIAAGAFFRHTYVSLRWRDFLNGVVVFMEERVPGGSR